MFPLSSPVSGRNVRAAGHGDRMADLFAIVGLITVGLLGITRWWEER
jgi:hypothetical protein